MKINRIEKALAAIAPHAALKRAVAKKQLGIVNSGYGQSGASHSKRSLKGWFTSPGSPKEDIDNNLNTLRARSRDIFMTSAIGRSALNTVRTNVVGSGLKLKSRIDTAVIGIDEKTADEREQNTEREFKLWADSEAVG